MTSHQLLVYQCHNKSHNLTTYHDTQFQWYTVENTIWPILTLLPSVHIPYLSKHPSPHLPFLMLSNQIAIEVLQRHLCHGDTLLGVVTHGGEGRLPRQCHGYGHFEEQIKKRFTKKLERLSVCLSICVCMCSCHEAHLQ